LDLLELRFNELYDSVDHFVIAESNLTFKGAKKELVFQQSRDRFKQFLDKVIYVLVDDMPDPATAWERESFQRNALRRGLTSVRQDDFVVITDADEILRPSALKAARSNPGATIFDMPMYQFYINMQAKPSGWRKVFGFSGALSADLKDFNEPRVDPLVYFNKHNIPVSEIDKAGWHFTFLGGAEKVREKLKAYSHAGDVVDAMLDVNGVENQMLVGRQVGNIQPLRLVRIDDTFPNYVQQNLEAFVQKGVVKDVFERVAELETLSSEDLGHVAADMEKRLIEMRKAHDFAQQRRAETGKRLEWMTGQVAALKATMEKISALTAEGDSANLGERLAQIRSLSQIS
jgi:hypothetical protein